VTTITWLHPEVWWTLPAALLAFAVWRLARRRTFVAFSAVRWLAALHHRPSPLRRLPELLAVLSLAFIVGAWMDPALPYSESDIRSQGLDIALVLDLSSSMQETMDLQRPPQSMQHLTFSNRDAAPSRPPGRTRLDTTKDALRDFIKRRRDDRIGLIVFSDNAYVVSPLTFDYDNLLNYVDMVDDQILRGEGMTAIGDGIGLASYVLVRQSTDDRRNKVVVVFTDGENNFGRDPLQTLADADAAGIRVHVIGVDLEEEVKKKPAVVALIAAVRRYGGQYYSADTVRELRAAYAAVDSLEKGLLTSKVYVQNAPVFSWLAVPGLVLLLCAVSIRAFPYFADFT
jgi:Ca-activated chloride channel family protein